MGEWFQLGGFVMYPVAFFGALTVALAAVTGASPTARASARLRAAGLLTLMCGVLGTTLGVMLSLRYAAGQPEQGKFIALGTYESLHNLAFAVGLVALAVLLRLVRLSLPGAGGPAAAARAVDAPAST